MILIEKTIISDDVVEKKFCCDLTMCHGACCIEGESGAPLEYDETVILDRIFPKVKPYMEEDGIKTIEEFGKWVIDSDGDFVTPLVGGRGKCAYVFFRDGIACCAIEKANAQNKITYKKPISCHLYPIRITSHKDYDALNYNKWSVCSPACRSGEKKNVAVYKFVKDALIRKYGSEWYKQLEGADEFKMLKAKEIKGG